MEDPTPGLEVGLDEVNAGGMDIGSGMGMVVGTSTSILRLELKVSTTAAFLVERSTGLEEGECDILNVAR